MRPYLVELLTRQPETDVVLRSIYPFVSLKYAKSFAERQKSLSGFVRSTVYELCASFDRVLEVYE